MALGAEPGSAGLAGSSMAAGPWGHAWAAGAVGVHLHPTSLKGWPGVPLSKSPPRLLPSLPGPAVIPCSLSLEVPLLFVPPSLCAPPPAALRLAACAQGLCCLPSPQGSLPADTLSPWSLSPPPCICLFFFPPAPLNLSPSGFCLAPHTSAYTGLVSMSLCPQEPMRGWGWGCL